MGFKLYIFILFSFILLISCSKKSENANNLNQLIKFLDSEEYTLSSEKNKLHFIDSVAEKIDELPNDSITKKLAFKISNVYYDLKDNRKSFIFSKKAYYLSQKQKDSTNMGRALYYMGDCYENTKKDSAYYYYKESEKIFRLTNNKDRLAKVHYNKAHLLFYEGNYVESEIEVIKALQNLDSLPNYKQKYFCYSLQSSIHTQLSELDKALTYYELAENILNDLKNEGIDSDTIYRYSVIDVTDLCNIYDEKGEYQKSIKRLSKIITPELKERLDLYSHVIGNLAYSKMKDGDLKGVKELYEEAISIASNNKLERTYLYKILSFGEYYLITKDTVKAKEYLTEALELSKKISSGKETLKSLDFLSKVDTKNASLYKNEYIRVTDSIIKKQRASSNKFARIEYETGEIENANKVLTKRNFYLFLGSSLSIIIFLILLILRHRKAQKIEIDFLEQKKAADDELFELIKENQIQLEKVKENIQNKIAKELHDGVMNQLTAIRFNLYRLKESPTQEVIDKSLTYVDQIQHVEKEIRNLSHNLNHETNFNQVDFSYLLNNLIVATNQINETVFTCVFKTSIDWSAYSSLIKINIYRILQELCSNVNKYAHAKHCIIKFIESEDVLSINVDDDGIGFDSTQKSNGIGMKNIKQRIKTIDGKLTITSSKGSGCKVYMEIKRKQ